MELELHASSTLYLESGSKKLLYFFSIMFGLLVGRTICRAPPNTSSLRFLRILSVLNAKQNYFDVFNLPLSYDLAVDQLTPKYRNLLKKSHPDKFHQKSQEEKERSEEHSRLINQAYRVLLNPLERGRHLLELKNSPMEEGKLDASSELLMEIYEINHELSETKDISRLQQVKEENDVRISTVVGEISTAFKNNHIEDAKKLLSQLNYYTTIEERIRSLELELGVVR